MRATRRTFRTAAIATGAIAALAVPATAAFADTTPQPVASDDQSQNQDQNQDQNGTDGQDQATPDQNGTDHTDQNARQLIKSTDLAEGFSAKVYSVGGNGAEADIFKAGALVTTLKANGSTATTTTGGYVFQLTPDGQLTADQDSSGDRTQPPVPGGWESKGTTDLGHGWTADVKVNASARTAKADIAQNGTAKGHLTAYVDDATKKIDGYTFTLTSDGTVTAKKDAKPAPDHRRQYVKTVRLADGVSVAKVYKLDTCHYQADVYAHGQRLDTLDANNRTAYGQNNGLHVALKPNGNVTSWLDAAHKKTQHTKPAPQPHSGSGTGSNTGTGTGTGTRTLPQGGVKAGAENVSAHTSGGTDSTPLIAAGAGAAAVGAAGLGFAMYRRKNHN
ncbi:hypothetical protein [Streptomyces longispororuber]|uniref:hypothetical protein n=1 Tax=Streptomyces longispororuber TaxID=68230 RepID=UPI002109C743|nr:hypothetical protein [Streptomyces longispororuber]MCQ4212559.1 hypothetical protein [Streptomyces longispororuber]